jgi:hypothetical protein
MNEAAVSLRPDERTKTFGLVAVTVENRVNHHLSRFEIDGEKRISQHRSNFPPEIVQG